MIPRIASGSTSFSPLPCEAGHGYKVTSTHRVEVEAGADGLASAPLSGAAGGRPLDPSHKCFRDYILLDTVPFRRIGHIYVKCFLARRVRTDQWWVEGVRADGR
jgi:hypothetical protein